MERYYSDSDIQRAAMNHAERWSGLRRTRLSRRRLLAASGRAGIGAAGLALVGCGGDDDDDDAVAQTADDADAQPQAQAQADQAQAQAQTEEEEDVQQAMDEAVEEVTSTGPYDALLPEDEWNEVLNTIPASQERYPLVVEFNWRKLDWSGPPYVGGTLKMIGIPPLDYNLMTTETLTQFPMYMNGLFYSALHQGVNLDGPAVRPDLALATETNADFTEFTFTLPDNVFFHDIEPVNGAPMTAEEVKFSFDRYIDSSVWNLPLGNVERIEAMGPTTIKFVLARPEPGLPNTLALPYYQVFHPLHFDDADRFAEIAIGTGAWQLTKSEPFVESKAIRHPRYWDTSRWLRGAASAPLPFADNLDMLWIPDQNQQDAGLRSGDLDGAHMEAVRPSRVRELQETNPDMQFASNIHWGLTHHRAWLQWNNPVLQDERVRRALSMALDRQRIVDIAQEGAGVPESTPIPFDQMGFDGPPTADQMGEYWAYDPDAARDLLDSAGYGDGLNLTALWSATTLPDWIPLVQQFWGDVGVNLELEQVETLRLSAILLEKDFDDITFTSGAGSILGYDLPTTVGQWRPESPQNWGNVDDPGLNDIIAEIDAAIDPEEWPALARRFHDRFHETQAAIYVAGYHSFFATQPWIHTIANSLYTTILNFASVNWRSVWIDDTAPGGRGGTRFA